MKKILLFLMFIGVSLFAQTEDQKLLNHIKKLEQRLMQYEEKLASVDNELSSIKAVHNESVSHYIQQEVNKHLSRNANLLSLRSSTENLSFKGDLRLRYERRERETTTSNDSRDRFRQRFRLGFVWKDNATPWTIEAGLATGDNSATSTNDTFSDGGAFETGDIRLDYAFAQRQFYDNFNIILGQHKNPFLSSGILWDGDVRPVGITIKYENENAFVLTGAYDVIHVGNDANDAFLYVLQAGLKLSSFKSALAYYHFTDALTSNDAAHLSGLPLSIDDDLEYHTLTFFNEYSTTLNSDIHLSVFSEMAVNLHTNGVEGSGSEESDLDPDDNKYYIVLGGVAKYQKFKFKYNYAYIESDSIYGGLKDSDFVTTNFRTGVKGHKIGFEYSLSKNLALGSTIYFVDEIKGNESLDQYEFDVQYKF